MSIIISLIFFLVYISLNVSQCESQFLHVWINPIAWCLQKIFFRQLLKVSLLYLSVHCIRITQITFDETRTYTRIKGRKFLMAGNSLSSRVLHGNASLAFKKIMSKYGLYIVGVVKKISLRITSAIFNAVEASRALPMIKKKRWLFGIIIL